MRRLLSALVFLMSASLVAGAQSEDRVIVGTVAALRGAVFREAGTAREPLAAKAPIYPADVIVSGEGKAKIILNDGSIIAIGENSRLRIADYQSVANGLKTRLDLRGGVLRLLVNRLPNRGQFEVESETAVASVRGTDWLVEVTPERTSVAVLEGVVAVAGRGAAGAPVVLDGPGQGTDVRRGEAPTAAHPWGAARLAATIARASFE
jgi:hypothetical protein